MTLWYLRKDDEPRRKIIDRETAQEAVEACGDEEEAILAGQEVWVALFSLPREPGDWESVDEETGAFILDRDGIDVFLHARIDAGAGAFRCRFITDVPGQEMTYQRKEVEARDYLAGGDGPWPFLTAQAAATGEDIEALATEVAARSNDWTVLGARIEGARMAAKQAVSAASTADGKMAAAEVDWETLLT